MTLKKNSLIQAVINRDYYGLNNLLRKCDEPLLNSVDSDGLSALHHAARKGFCVRPLIDANIDINIQDHAGNTALMLACCEGLCGVIKSLSQAGANPNIKNIFGKSPLQMLTLKGHVECLKQLVENGADIKLITADDINMALTYGRTGSVIYLLKVTADFRRFYKPGSSHPFHVALLAGNEECIRAMLDFGFFTGDTELHSVVNDVCAMLSHETKDHILSCCAQPLSLKQLSRLAIRKMLEEPLTPKKCERLPVPKQLQSYVSMSNTSAPTSRKGLREP